MECPEEKGWVHVHSHTDWITGKSKTQEWNESGNRDRLPTRAFTAPIWRNLVRMEHYACKFMSLMAEYDLPVDQEDLEADVNNDSVVQSPSETSKLHSMNDRRPRCGASDVHTLKEIPIQTAVRNGSTLLIITEMCEFLEFIYYHWCISLINTLAPNG